MEIRIIKEKITEKELQDIARKNYGESNIIMIKDKWTKMTLSQQMGNIGSEVFRIINFKQKDDYEKAGKSFAMALELIDLTIEDKRWKGRVLEVLRLREIISDFYLDKKIYNVSPDNLKKYFIPFALINLKN